MKKKSASRLLLLPLLFLGLCPLALRADVNNSNDYNFLQEISSQTLQGSTTGWQNIVYSGSVVGTTEFLIVSFSHGNPSCSQMNHIFKHKVQGGDWSKAVTAGNDDKSAEIWMRHVTSSNRTSLGQLDTGGAGAVHAGILVYEGLAEVTNTAGVTQCSTTDIAINSNGSGPYLVIAASDNGTAASNQAMFHFSPGDDRVFIYLTNDSTFEDTTTGNLRGAIASLSLDDIEINDTTDPVVSFASPTTTLDAGENLHLTVNASDSNGIDRVYLYKNNVELARSEGAAPYDFGATGQNDPELQNLQPGVYEFRAVATDPSGNEGEATVTVTVNAINTTGELLIEAEDFDVNSGFQAQTTTDVGGGQNLGYTTVGDYVEYNISLASAGVYEVIFRVASFSQGAKFDLKDGSTVLCSVDEPATGDNQNWVTTAPQVISLPAGNTTLRILATGNSWNINWFKLIPLQQSLVIEAEDFDVNSGFQTQATSDVGGGQNIGYTDVGDYVEYNITADSAGAYEVIFRVASFSQGAKFDLKDGSTVLCSVDEPATGGFQTWVTTAPQVINLPAGNTDLRILATGPSWNMNWFELIPLYLVKIQAEDFDSTVGFGTQNTTDIGGGSNLKDATAGDTATYLNVNIPVSGTYEATFRIASLNQPVRFDLKKGTTTLVTVDQPATGGYQIWTSWTTPVANRFYLPAGNSTLTIEANGVGWNLNWFDLKLVD